MTGVSLDGIVSVVEGGQAVVPLAARADAPEAALRIEPGLQEILAGLTVTFAIS